jgi:hypothetical protein
VGFPTFAARRIAAICLSALWLSAAALAQDARGKILGLVTDASGAPVPSAVIAAIQIEMNTTTSARTNSTGNYELPFLLPGPYRLEVAAPGFKNFRQEPIEVRVGETATVDVRLELGAVTETVKVTAEAPLIEESNASLGQTVERHQLENLPIGGDDVMYLLQLGAGITTTQTPGHNWLPSAVDVMSTATAGGTRSGSSEFSLDGIPNMTGTMASFAPPADIVSEFRVEVAKFDASLGHGMGAHVNTSIKSGTNVVRGTASWQIAPNPWQANDFFGNKQLYDLSSGPVTPEKRAQMAPPRKVNRYSFTSSGPLVLPRLYNGRNRTFWTYGFQGFNRRNPSSTYLTVPTAEERAGDFSQLLAISSQYRIYDPATITPAAGGRFSRQPLAGNIIPTSRLDPMAQRILQFYPLPNQRGSVDFQDNYQVAGNNSNDFLQHMGRVDHVINERHRVFGRFTYSWLNFYRNQYFHNESRGLDRYRHQRGVALDDVYVVSPSFLVNLKYGMTWFNQPDRPFSVGYDLVGLGFPASFASQLDPQGVSFPQIAMENVDKLGESTNTNETTLYHTWGASVTQFAGAHSLKWGGEFRLMRESSYNFGNGSPLLNFANNYTRGPLDNSGGAPMGQGIASFLLGIPTGGNVDLNASSATQSTFTGLYLQDDWKIARRLTLNLGIRWEYESAPTERFDRTVVGFDFQAASPIQAAAAANYAKSPIPQIAAADFRTLGGLTFAGRDGARRGLYHTSKRNFAPRVGFAWRVAPNMAVRGGYGVFYDLLGIDRIGVTQTGFSQRTTLTPTLDNGQTWTASLSNPFPNLLKPAPVGLSTYLGQAVSFQPTYRPHPYLQNWTISIQRQLFGRTVLDVSYMGNRLTRMAVNREYNGVPRQYLSSSPNRDQTVINLLTAAVTNPFNGAPEFSASGIAGKTVARSQLLRPYPHFTSITAPDPVGFSWYHSLQVRLSKRLSHGLSLTANYTFSKMMEAASFLNDTDAMPEHVIAAQDRPHRFVPTVVYELPVGRNRRFGAGMNRVADAIAGGWQAQGIFHAQTGAPLAFGNILYRGASLADIVLPKDQRSIERWFNTDAGFEKLTGQQLGQNIRAFPSRLTGLRGPGINYWDLSMTKNFRISDRMRLQFRTNWEGAMNHPQFSTPNMTTTNVLFGSINATVGEGRRVYAGLKLYY